MTSSAKRPTASSDVLSTSTAARAPLLVVISTQSGDPHHVMTELVDYGQQILDGVLEDPAFLPVDLHGAQGFRPLGRAHLARVQPGPGRLQESGGDALCSVAGAAHGSS